MKKTKIRKRDVLNAQKANITLNCINNKFKFAYSDYFIAFWKTLIFTVCACAFCSIAKDVYSVPIKTQTIIYACLVTVVLSRVLYAFLYIFIPLKSSLGVLFQILGTLLTVFIIPPFRRCIYALKDFFLVIIDSYPFYTSGFSSYDPRAIYKVISFYFEQKPLYGSSFELLQFIQNGFIIYCVIITLLFLFASTKRFIGIVFVSSVILIFPSFFIGTFSASPYVYILLIGMMAIFGGWCGGYFVDSSLSKFSPTKLPKNFSENTINKSSLQKFFESLSFPRYNTILSLSAGVLAFVTIISVSSVFPKSKHLNFFDMIAGDGNNSLLSIYNKISDKFSDRFTFFSDGGGYFSGGTNFTNGRLSLSPPSQNNRSTLKITCDNFDAPIYLRASIATEFNSKDFSVTSTNKKISALESLIEDGFYPETEAQIAKLFLNSSQMIVPSSFEYNLISMLDYQNVDIEYLSNSKNVFTPSYPFAPEYLGNNSYTVSLDSYIVSNETIKNGDNIRWTTLYPRTYNVEFGYALNLMEQNITSVKYSSEYIYINSADGEYSSGTFYPDGGISVSKYFSMLKEYRSFIKEIYTVTDKDEAENMMRLYNDISEKYGDLSKKTLYDTAYSIENYLQNNFVYSLTADNTRGGNTVLGNFLFETKEGWCTFYALSMTELLRNMNIPARFVTGYIADDFSLNSLGRYETTLKESNAHAWVEVYFENFGWVPFNPTPAINQDTELIRSSTSSDTSSETSSTTTTTSSDTQTTRSTSISSTENTSSSIIPASSNPRDNRNSFSGSIFEKIIYVFLFLMIFAVFYIPIRICLKRFKNAEKSINELMSGNSKNKRKDIIIVYSLILKLLELKGFVREKNELIKDFASRAELTKITYIIQKIEYDKCNLTEKDCRILSDFAKKLKIETIDSKKNPKRIFRKIKVFKRA